MVRQVHLENPLLGLSVLLEGFDLGTHNDINTCGRSGVLQPAQDSNACGTADAAGGGGLVYLHVVPLLVRDEGHAVDPGQPAVLQQSLLGLNTTKGDAQGGSVVNQLNLFHQLHPAVP